ncbi:helicase-related protein [Streptomyces sp. NPDC020719]|uniref:helicase-related protein n=1 Tax=Streptomyces sp. NPDC020719 TaxID=3154896 RepID=UPI00340785A8
MKFDQHYAFRDELVVRLQEDLVGPADPSSTEQIHDQPITKYAAGILFPQDAASVEESSPLDEDVEGGRPALDAVPDPAVAMANVRYPSSMGMTFSVDVGISSMIQLAVTVARYAPESTSDGATRRTRSGGREVWRRVPVPIKPQSIDVTQPRLRDQLSLAEGLELFLRIRPRDARGIVSVTAILINKNAARGGSRDEASFFQPGIKVTGMDGVAPFVERPAPGTSDGDQELASYRLLYRHRPSFATGHGCAVEWEDNTGCPGSHGQVRAHSIETTFTPAYELWLSDSNPEIDTTHLGMLHLATAPADQAITSLRALVEGYSGWIAVQRKAATNLATEQLRITADEHLGLCDESCARMARGIDALRDPIVMEAFQLANRAMAMQRARTEWLKVPRDERPAEPDERVGVWRPFQIAFMLVALNGIADKSSPDRDLADVLWFPTGGGKTEAYLGLIAFTVFLRRLRSRHDAGGGVTVLMRYTLRLLTSQQFERATLLICCMEYLRRQDEARRGRTEISIGMWVGKASTPNKLEDARKALRKHAKRDEVTEKDPMQIRSCPWCGIVLDHRNYKPGTGRLTIACGAPACSFRDGLPVHVVDETIYAERPTLIIATADKFASIPWVPSVAELFNLGHPEPAPELVIQDELHLISGPLGTLAGLYESAVDLAADRPKIVASTATIRRAGSQGRALFDREVKQFPPPGLDARDSYFAVETPPVDKASRTYVGLMAPATSQTSLLVRAYAALLHHAKAIEGIEAVRDAYWTLLGYFNSLRLLAGARLQVHDDVEDRLRLLARTLGPEERRGLVDIELTSREPSGAIPRHLQNMAVALPAESIDVILATNMVSVGVDVDRLGLMVVMGQPQSTSEYIQATSRVGRKWPGLVVTLFNAARSRDRSHYENFTTYHSALYRQVEATSVTPFSVRARDRGLHAVVIGLARLLIPAARSNEAAVRISSFESQLRAECEQVLSRVRSIAGEREYEAARRQIDQIITDWIGRAAAEPELVYSDPRRPARALLMDAGRHDETDDEFADTLPTLWSLRDVDVETKLYLARGI